MSGDYHGDASANEGMLQACFATRAIAILDGARRTPLVYGSFTAPAFNWKGLTGARGIYFCGHMFG